MVYEENQSFAISKYALVDTDLSWLLKINLSLPPHLPKEMQIETPA